MARWFEVDRGSVLSEEGLRLCESTGIGGGLSFIARMGLEFLDARTQGPDIAAEDGDGGLKYGGAVNDDGVGLVALAAVGDGWS